ncbi:MAG: hypothetical protein QME81_09900, partial [bacterium]|nr:hypothetical protein [bacterium]
MSNPRPYSSESPSFGLILNQLLFTPFPQTEKITHNLGELLRTAGEDRSYSLELLSDTLRILGAKNITPQELLGDVPFFTPEKKIRQPHPWNFHIRILPKPRNQREKTLEFIKKMVEDLSELERDISSARPEVSGILSDIKFIVRKEEFKFLPNKVTKLKKVIEASSGLEDKFIVSPLLNQNLADIEPLLEITKSINVEEGRLSEEFGKLKKGQAVPLLKIEESLAQISKLDDELEQKINEISGQTGIKNPIFREPFLDLINKRKDLRELLAQKINNLDKAPIEKQKDATFLHILKEGVEEVINLATGLLEKIIPLQKSANPNQEGSRQIERLDESVEPVLTLVQEIRGLNQEIIRKLEGIGEYLEIKKDMGNLDARLEELAKLSLKLNYYTNISYRSKGIPDKTTQSKTAIDLVEVERGEKKRPERLREKATATGLSEKKAGILEADPAASEEMECSQEFGDCIYLSDQQLPKLGKVEVEGSKVEEEGKEIVEDREIEIKGGKVEEAGDKVVAATKVKVEEAGDKVVAATKVKVE